MASDMADEETAGSERPNNNAKARRIKIGAFIVLVAGGCGDHLLVGFHEELRNYR